VIKGYVAMHAEHDTHTNIDNLFCVRLGEISGHIIKNDFLGLD
jgi:hypothetical protein